MVKGNKLMPDQSQNCLSPRGNKGSAMLKSKVGRPTHTRLYADHTEICRFGLVLSKDLKPPKLSSAG